MVSVHTYQLYISSVGNLKNMRNRAYIALQLYKSVIMSDVNHKAPLKKRKRFRTYRTCWVRRYYGNNNR